MCGIIANAKRSHLQQARDKFRAPALPRTMPAIISANDRSRSMVPLAAPGAHP
jgi:hypothetical protein